MILHHLIALRDRWYDWKTRQGYRRKIAALLRGLDGPLAEVAPESMTIRRFVPGYDVTHWHVAYTTLSGKFFPDYLPEDLFYTEVEPRLNDPAAAAVYRDKICLGFLMPEDIYVGNQFFRRQGRFHDHTGAHVDRQQVVAWIEAEGEAVAKPSSDSGGGRGVVIGTAAEVIAGVDAAPCDLVIQRRFRQHPEMARFHADSLNTIRVMSLRRDGDIHPLSATTRSGVGGSRVDNVTAGAVALGVDLETGVLRDFALDYHFRRFDSHPSSGLVFKGQTVPFWPRVLDLVKRCHDRCVGTDLVSWDIAIGESGEPKLIEANLRAQEINGHQLMNGAIFGPHLDHIMNLPR